MPIGKLEGGIFMRRKVNVVLRGAAIFAMLVFAQQARATMAMNTTSSTFNVTGTIEATCTVIAENHQFGAIAIPTPEDVPIDSISAIRVTCPPSVGYTVSLSFGNNPKGTQRRMNWSGNLINYNLYVDTTRTSIWGDGTGNSAVLAGGGTGTEQRFSVFGRIQPKQSGPPGTYSDTITVTITY